MDFKPSLIQLNVSDADVAKQFYCGTLGFEEQIIEGLDGAPVLKSSTGVPVLLYPYAETSASSEASAA